MKILSILFFLTLLISCSDTGKDLGPRKGKLVIFNQSVATSYKLKVRLDNELILFDGTVPAIQRRPAVFKIYLISKVHKIEVLLDGKRFGVAVKPSTIDILIHCTSKKNPIVEYSEIVKLK